MPTSSTGNGGRLVEMGFAIPAPPARVEDSVSGWLTGLCQGDAEAARRIWDRYYLRLVRISRAKLRRAARTLANEEDVALSAFDSLFRGAAEGRFPRLKDRDGLWGLLLTIAARKSITAIRRERAAKRGGGAAAELLPERGADDEWSAAWGAEPSHEFAVEAAEQLGLLVGNLQDALLTRVVLLRLEGWSVREIARRIDRAPDTVRRKLLLVRQRWLREHCG